MKQAGKEKRCWWIFNHNWTNWSDVSWGKGKSVIRETTYNQQFIVQTRDCKKCKGTGKKEVQNDKKINERATKDS